MRVIHTVDTQREEQEVSTSSQPVKCSGGGGFRIGVLGRLGGGGAVRHQNFNDTIISSVINNHRGYIPMERPYSLLWQEEDEEDDDLQTLHADDEEELKSVDGGLLQSQNDSEESDDLGEVLTSASPSSSTSTSLESLELEEHHSSTSATAQSFNTTDAIATPTQYHRKKHRHRSSVDEELEL